MRYVLSPNSLGTFEGECPHFLKKVIPLLAVIHVQNIWDSNSVDAKVSFLYFEALEMCTLSHAILTEKCPNFLRKLFWLF
jgi:hypothetical protein